MSFHFTNVTHKKKIIYNNGQKKGGRAFIGFTVKHILLCFSTVSNLRYFQNSHKFPYSFRIFTE